MKSFSLFKNIDFSVLSRKGRISLQKALLEADRKGAFDKNGPTREKFSLRLCNLQKCTTFRNNK